MWLESVAWCIRPSKAVISDRIDCWLSLWEGDKRLKTTRSREVPAPCVDTKIAQEGIRWEQIVSATTLASSSIFSAKITKKNQNNQTDRQTESILIIWFYLIEEKKEEGKSTDLTKDVRIKSKVSIISYDDHISHVNQGNSPGPQRNRICWGFYTLITRKNDEGVEDTSVNKFVSTRIFEVASCGLWKKSWICGVRRRLASLECVQRNQLLRR